MSNRTRLRPPPAVAAYARAYRCSDCSARAGKPRRAAGSWHVDVRHDDSCPVLTGSVDKTAAGVAAAVEAARTTGTRALYIGVIE